jgi:heptaprenyl diphosphate synthase
MIGEGDALGINIVRIMLSAMMFTGGAALIYSLCGGILSFIVMTALKRTGSFGICAVSAAGGVAHNTGQIAAAVFLLRSRMIVWYLPPLWIAGVVSGLLVGLVSGLVCIKLKNIDIYPFL